MGNVQSDLQAQQYERTQANARCHAVDGEPKQHTRSEHAQRRDRGRSVEQVVRSITMPLQLVGGVLVTTLTIVNIWEQIRLTRAVLKRMTSSSPGLPDNDGPYGEREAPTGKNDLRLDAVSNTVLNTADLGQSIVTWDKIAGLKPVKIILQEVTVLPLLRPDLFQGVRQPPCGILLFGPPGSGKTLLARAVATESRATFIAVTGSNILSMWVGESEQNVKGLFEKARKQQPSVIFIDEVDSLLGKRNGARADSAHDRRVTNEFLAFIDGIQTGRDGSRVIVIAATNNPWDLDEAALSRFARRVYVPLPDKASRAEMLKKTLQGVPSCLSEEEYLRLAERTSKYSGRDLVQVCREASMLPLRELWGEHLLESCSANALTERKLVDAAATFIANGTARKRLRRSLEHWKKRTRSDWCNLDEVLASAEQLVQCRKGASSGKGIERAASKMGGASKPKLDEVMACCLTATASKAELQNSANAAEPAASKESQGSSSFVEPPECGAKEKAAELGAAAPTASQHLETPAAPQCAETAAAQEQLAAGLVLHPAAASTPSSGRPDTADNQHNAAALHTTCTSRAVEQQAATGVTAQPNKDTSGTPFCAVIDQATTGNATQPVQPPEPRGSCSGASTTGGEKPSAGSNSSSQEGGKGASAKDAGTWSLSDLLTVSAAGLRGVTMGDFEAALHCIMCTELDLSSRYQEWNQAYGSGSDKKTGQASLYSSMYI